MVWGILKIQTVVLMPMEPRLGTAGARLTMCSPSSSACLTHLISCLSSHSVPSSLASLSTTHALLQSLPSVHPVHSLPWIYTLSSLSLVNSYSLFISDNSQTGHLPVDEPPRRSHFSILIPHCPLLWKWPLFTH